MFPVLHNVEVNRQTTLQSLYTYPPGAVLEYPETSSTGFVGHLFMMDIDNWSNPSLNFAYSQGRPSGSKKEGDCEVLKDRSGARIPCRVSHTTCQGCKVCPYSDMISRTTPHSSASRDDLRVRIHEDRLTQQANQGPQREIFETTLALWTALQKFGCTGPPQVDTVYSESERAARERHLEIYARIRRGHDAKHTCDGRLLLDYDLRESVIIRCEHHDHRMSKNHLYLAVGRGPYDIDYLTALFYDDREEIEEYESLAQSGGYGPLVACTTVYNFSSNKVNCPRQHRNADGSATVSEVVPLECHSTFRVFEPWESHRKECPMILVVCGGPHRHPIPLPTKTPQLIRHELTELLARLDLDLPDMTPRRFLRHSALRVHLSTRLPSVVNPMLSDLHPSLSNRDHLRVIIAAVQKEKFPHGTGWKGLLDMKARQDLQLPASEHYIRFMGEVDLDKVVGSDDEDEDEDGIDGKEPFRYVVCMSPDASRRLLQCQYLQSDIGFKRVAGFFEFEIGALDREGGSRTSIAFARVYLTRQTAKAHLLVLQKIEEIVKIDTGSSLRWRPLHADNAGDVQFKGILQWAGDQHGGQAKGLGLHLQRLAQDLGDRRDLHEPYRLLSDLSPYDHLHRVFRLCEVHVFRNIRESKVIPAEIKPLMRSLVCLRHADWDSTIQRIQTEGGKGGQDWVQDKIRSGFAFEAMCWEKSRIPELIWKAGDSNSNVIEILHSDVNREGVHCSLVGGVSNGRHYDTLKMKSLDVFGGLGIRTNYQKGHISETIEKKLKRKATSQTKDLGRQDISITSHNKRLKKASDAKTKAEAKLAIAQQNLDKPNGANLLEKAEKTLQKANDGHVKALAASRHLAEMSTGSGNVVIEL